MNPLAFARTFVSICTTMLSGTSLAPLAMVRSFAACRDGNLLSEPWRAEETTP